MSLHANEYTTIMKELSTSLSPSPSGSNNNSMSVTSRRGPNTTDSTSHDHETFHVRHQLSISFDDRYEKLIHRVVSSMYQLGTHLVVSIRILTIATSITLLLWGTSHIIQQIRGITKSKKNNEEMR
jgi:hypothetical protein